MGRIGVIAGYKSNNFITMAAPVTLKELARILNLSPSTVSRALKGHPDISKVTQERVKTMADDMQYRPSAMAQGLRNRRFYLIAVIIPDLSDYFYITALQGIIEYAYDKNYKVIVFESREQSDIENDICLTLQKSGIDGLLVSPSRTTTEPSHLKKFLEESIPLVFLDRMIGNVEADKIMGDDYSGACIAVKHLIDIGCKRIAHLAASKQWLWAQKRQIGYMQALQEHHLTVDRDLMIEYEHLEEITEIIENWIKQFHIDGIFAVDDISAIKALMVIRRLRGRIPQDIAVCGYGNYPISEVTCPSLTTIDRKGKQMGQLAMSTLIQRIENKLTGETKTFLLKNELVIRNSTLIGSSEV